MGYQSKIQDIARKLVIFKFCDFGELISGSMATIYYGFGKFHGKSQLIRIVQAPLAVFTLNYFLSFF